MQGWDPIHSFLPLERAGPGIIISSLAGRFNFSFLHCHTEDSCKDTIDHLVPNHEKPKKPVRGRGAGKERVPASADFGGTTPNFVSRSGRSKTFYF